MTMTLKTNLTPKKNILDKQEVAWHNSALTYNYLYEIDMSYLDAYMSNNYIQMEKLFKKKYSKVKAFVEKYATETEKNILDDDTQIKQIKSTMKEGNNDFSNRYNRGIVPNLIEQIDKKMDIVELLMAKAGMTLFLSVKDIGRPAALGNDDFVFGKEDD
jgi:hypothetical protein